MRRPNWVPEGTDLDKPNAARVYDYYLGGSHNFEVDREMARKAIALWPELPQIMRSNRAFLRRAVQFTAERGISRFLDIGSGIPTFGAVHEIARAIRPESQVVYIDRDPVAVAHNAAAAGGRPGQPRRPGRRPGRRRPDVPPRGDRAARGRMSRWPSCWSPSCTSSRTRTTRGS